MFNGARVGKSMYKYLASVMLLSTVLMTACSTTQKAPTNEVKVNCGLLGRDVCRKLVRGTDKEANLRYINPAARWTSYNKVLIEPVTFWGDDATSVSVSDQHMLVDYFLQQLHAQFGKRMQIADKPGPGVMKVSVSMLDADSATPVLRSISMIVPQAHMLANLEYLATGALPFVGSAESEVKVTDSMTGKLLGAAVDERLGGGNITTGFQWEWGDAENAIDNWCERIATNLAAWTSGAETP